MKIGAKIVGHGRRAQAQGQREHLRRLAPTLELSDIGVTNIHLDHAIAFDPYGENRQTGGFVIIDRITNDTVGAGLLDFALWRSDNVKWQDLDVDKNARAAAKSQKPCVVWFTGLSGSGKSTIANVLETKFTPRASTPTCSTATTSGTASTRTSASPTRTAWRTSAGHGGVEA